MEKKTINPRKDIGYSRNGRLTEHNVVKIPFEVLFLKSFLDDIICSINTVSEIFNNYNLYQQFTAEKEEATVYLSWMRKWNEQDEN